MECSTHFYAIFRPLCVYRDTHRFVLTPIDVWEKDRDKKQSDNRDVHKGVQRITKEYQNPCP
jgi:hypothetical protein